MEDCIGIGIWLYWYLYTAYDYSLSDSQVYNIETR